MIDFHYSDKWADPGQQSPPAAWASHNLAQLNTDVYQHTQGTLKYLKDNGITVDWVQVSRGHN
jgi:arabinogalactan endo-1,4-beta-galactosidase